MPNRYYIENKALWDSISDIDYLPLFVSAWLSFNAWYRNVYDEDEEELRDRDVIDKIKDEDNSIRNSIVPKFALTDQDGGFRPSQEEESFFVDIASLHSNLERYSLYSGKGIKRRRITFSNIHLRDRPMSSITKIFSSVEYSIIVNLGSRGGVSLIEVRVKGRSGNIRFIDSHNRYDIDRLSSLVRDGDLNEHQSQYVLALYRGLNPKAPVDLLNCGVKIIRCGSIDFKCTEEDLYAGVIEILYQMRCHLFHGELVPNENAIKCYEPAYRILKYILRQIS